jgi:hypothetical protein
MARRLAAEDRTFENRRPLQPTDRPEDLLDRLKEYETANQQLVQEILLLRQRNEDRESLIGDLVRALSSLKLLHGLLPICASCKKIRDDQGSWNLLEKYICQHTEAEFTHGLCPECEHRLYPQLHRHK